VEVNGTVLTARMVNYHGTVRDLFSIVKEGRVEPKRLALPWQPPEFVKAESTDKSPATPPVTHRALIAGNAEWRYLVTDNPRGQHWTSPAFDPTAWRLGRASFGFGDGEFATKITPVRGQPTAIYLRREFQIAQADAVTEIGLLIDYSDGFIAYVNGREVARINIARSSGRNVQTVKARGARGATYLPLNDAHLYLRDGANVLAIEAHANADPSDFRLNPVLLIEE